jgi:hypothetical protein
LLQSREELIKVQANRIAELENMIGLRTSAVPMLMNEPFMLNLDKKVSWGSTIPSDNAAGCKLGDRSGADDTGSGGVGNSDNAKV